MLSAWRGSPPARPRPPAALCKGLCTVFELGAHVLYLDVGPSVKTCDGETYEVYDVNAKRGAASARRNLQVV